MVETEPWIKRSSTMGVYGEEKLTQTPDKTARLLATWLWLKIIIVAQLSHFGDEKGQAFRGPKEDSVIKCQSTVRRYLHYLLFTSLARFPNCLTTLTTANLWRDRLISEGQVLSSVCHVNCVHFAWRECDGGKFVAVNTDSSLLHDKLCMCIQSCCGICFNPNVSKCWIDWLK